LSRKNEHVIERKILLTNDVGLHARPAAKFVKSAAKFKSRIKVLKGENEADAKSITSILFLDAKKGEEITIWAKGEDSDLAVESLSELIREF
jgi:phosphotransferase system HPr (HPr) family protein